MTSQYDNQQLLHNIMKRNTLRSILTALWLVPAMSVMAQVATPTHQIEPTFTIPTPNYKVSPYTGLDRQGWIDAAELTKQFTVCMVMMHLYIILKNM